MKVLESGVTLFKCNQECKHVLLPGPPEDH